MYDVQNLKAFDVIEAHNSPISCLAFSPSGETLATASGKGTVIRVFATPSGEKLFELRRGIQTSAQIFSMAFSEDASLLSVSSDKATVHIFKLEVVNQAPAPAANGGMMDYFSVSHLPSLFPARPGRTRARVPCKGVARRQVAGACLPRGRRSCAVVHLAGPAM